MLWFSLNNSTNAPHPQMVFFKWKLWEDPMIE